MSTKWTVVHVYNPQQTPWKDSQGRPRITQAEEDMRRDFAQAMQNHLDAEVLRMLTGNEDIRVSLSTQPVCEKCGEPLSHPIFSPFVHICKPTIDGVSRDAE